MESIYVLLLCGIWILIGCSNADYNQNCGDNELICLMVRQSHTSFCDRPEYIEKAKKYCPRTCGYCHPTFEHGTNLIWAQTPFMEKYFELSKLVSIHGDPQEWVSNRSPKVRYISAPYFDWLFRALGFHYQDQTLFWAESVNKKIQSLVLNSSTVSRTVFTGTSSDVHGMAVDWLSRNLYFTDSLYNWIIMCSTDPDKQVYKIVVQEGLDAPHGVAVHPQKGILLWSDWGERPRIEMSDLLGNNRRPLVEKDIFMPRALTVDYKTDSVYWVDTLKTSLEMIQLNGQGRTLIQKEEEGASYYGVTLYQDFIFVTERNRGMLKVFDRLKPAASFTLNSLPLDIIMYDESRQPGNATDCEDLGCEQLCVYDAVKGATCLCGEGFVGKDETNVQCDPTFRFVHPSHIYAIGDSICQYPANIADMSLANVTLDSQCFLEDSQGYMTLTYDAEENMLYYFGNQTKTISRIALEMGSKGRVISGGTGVVKGMALDWVSGNLYWTDSDQHHIKVAKKDGAYQTVLLEGLNNPVGIAVHPKRGKIYWTDHGHLPDVGAKVESANLDGSDRTLIMGDNLGQPNHLFIDFESDSLYWADSVLNHVRKVDLETTRISVILEQDNVKFYGLSFFRDFILWTDTEDHNGIHIARMDKKIKVRGIIHPKNGIAADLITFDPLHQPKINNSCSEKVSKCTQLCLVSSAGKPRCACGTGYELSTDGFTCVTSPVMNEFLLLSDAYQKQIFQMDLNNGVVVAAVELKPHHNPIALDYNPWSLRVIWSDNKASMIKQASVDGKYEKAMLLFQNGSMCDGLAADYVNRLLFYTDTGKNVIGVVSMRDFDLHRPIISEDLDEPRDIVVSPEEGTIYWSDWGTKPRIESSYMDGSSRQTIVAFNSTAWPNGLALEHKERMLYWVDAHSDTVSVIDLKTKQVTVLLEEENSHFFSVEVMGDYLYITDWKKNYLQRMSKHGGPLKKFGPSKFTRLYGIRGYNSSEAFKGISVCVYSVCDQLCLPVPTRVQKYACMCTEEFFADGPRCIKKNTPTLSPTTPLTMPKGKELTVTRPVTSALPPQSPSPKTPPTPHTTSEPATPGTSTSASSQPPSTSSSSVPQSPPSTTAPSSTPPSEQTTLQPTDVITKMPVTATYTDVTTDMVDVNITAVTSEPAKFTTNVVVSTDSWNVTTNNKTVIAEVRFQDTASGLSTAVVAAIVVSVLVVIGIAVVGGVMYRRRCLYKVSHGKLIEEKNPTDFYKIAYPSPGDDTVTFDSGIENPTYDYLNGPGSLTSSSSAQDGGAGQDS